MNLLDHFLLHQSLFTHLSAELFQQLPADTPRDAKIELSLTPRLLKDQPADQPPAYQLTASLSCKGSHNEPEEPVFNSRVVMETVYRQVSGDPISFDEFSQNHPSLTRQIYPLLLQKLKELLAGIGLGNVMLPADLSPRRESEENQSTGEVAASVIKQNLH